MEATTGAPDPYKPLERTLSIADPIQGIVNGSQRRAAVRLLHEHGARRVLDVGCGSGGLCCCLAKAGMDAVGLDASDTMLARAGAKAGTPPRFTVVRGEATDIPFDDGEFDSAIVSLALHEMDPSLRDTVFGEMNRVVRPGGLVVLIDFTLPDSDGPLARVGRRFIESDERGIGRIHPPHFENFSEFMANGGLAGWVRERDAQILAESRHLWGNVGVMALARH